MQKTGKVFFSMVVIYKCTHGPGNKKTGMFFEYIEENKKYIYLNKSVHKIL